MNQIKRNESSGSLSDDDLFNIDTLSDLVHLAYDYKKKHSDNNDVKKLWEIRTSIKEINQMVGLTELKKKLLYQILFFCQHLNNGEMMHTVLMGNPGVGKTTVAKKIGQIYKKLGFLSKGTFKIVGRDSLVGQYLGETAIKTQKVLDSCKGGVLFIDEAYSLGNTGDGDSYSKECLDTLNKFLSENTNDFVCIIAGYEKQLNESFFSRNPGLERRFPWKYTLKQYIPTELGDIFDLQMKQSKWKYRKPYYKKTILNILHSNKDLFKNNGGDTENLLNACKMVHSKRVFGSKKTWKRYLTRKDLEKGFNLYKSNREVKKESSPPFMMYI